MRGLCSNTLDEDARPLRYWLDEIAPMAVELAT